MALGLGRSVREVLALEAAEFDFWTAFFCVEPFGPRQRTWEAGVVASAAAAAFGGSKAAPADFFPSLKEKPKGAAAFRAWAASHCPAMQAQARQDRRNSRRVAH